ncbi:ATP-binding protein [Streptomyces sp. WMMC897]|uniref:ATP-binding protein n=1 Tax=Streptomyces sp. WMMC897 TaxID=3014782 RepID=UPI0022B6B0B4|nr:ATP-binding protein [Streptomyces sp. WMMC897]MCZ7414133.1 ATP-binding protein [Streptomyces sp. WMMC897]
MLNRPVERTGRRGKRARPRETWWAVTAAVAIGCGAAGAALPGAAGWPRAVLAALAVTAVVSVAAALRARRALAAAGTARERAEAIAGARGAEVAHLAGVRMPAIAERVRTGHRLDGVPGPLAEPAATGEDFARALAAVVAGLGSDEAVRRERALRDSVQAAFESVARNMHAMATVQQQVLDHVEQIITDSRLMGEVMKADHAAAQMTRKAQTLLVMCGIWPARRETRPVTLYDCVRGAQSRIVEFGRIDVHGGQTLYVVPPAVEGLMHSVAELLENATVFSPSSTQVVVTIREVGAGAVLEIDDAGLGMPPDVLHQALGRLRDDLDLAQLGAVPRLGLACVGRWSRELGFNVELTGASAYGGTRSVVFVPHRLLTEPLPDVAPVPRQARSRPAPRDAHAYAAPGPEPVTAVSAGPGTGADGQAAGPFAERASGPAEPELPRRRSRRRAPGRGLDGTPADLGLDGTPAGPGLDGTRSAPGPDGAGARTGRPGPDAPARPQLPDTGPLPPEHPAPADEPPPRPPAREWSPDAARASVASVVSGSRRGRAQAAEGDRYPGRLPDRHADPHADQHSGPRPGAPEPAGPGGTGPQATAPRDAAAHDAAPHDAGAPGTRARDTHHTDRDEGGPA